MFMAKPSPEHAPRRGSSNGSTYQLPSISHLLSSVQQPGALNGQGTYSDGNSTDQHLPILQRGPYSRSEDYKLPQIQPELAIIQASNSIGPQHIVPGSHDSPLRQNQSAYTLQPSCGSRISPTYRTQSLHQILDEIPTVPSPHLDRVTTKTVVREELVAGRGLCYVYSDGTICPKAIDNEAVNPKWGTTKAGKPRKRLGQACNTCREKKIRCDPQVPKCAQCEKFNRDCKFESGSKVRQHPSPARASPTLFELTKDTGHDRQASSASAETASELLCTRETSRSSINVESLLSPSSPAVSDEGPPSKKRRLSTSPMIASSKIPLHRRSPPEQLLAMPEGVTMASTQFSMNTDPLAIDKRLTNRYVRMYLDRVNGKLYNILPPSKTVQWINNGRPKKSSDLLIIYAIMGFGAMLANDNEADNEQHAQLFTQICTSILQGQSWNMDLNSMLGQLILSLLVLSTGQFTQSAAYASSILRLCYQWGLNSEEGLRLAIASGGCCLDLDEESAAECMRRVFWLSYARNTFHRYCFSGSERQTLDCELRLPCDNNMYDIGDIPVLSAFTYNANKKQEFSMAAGHGIMAFMIEAAIIVDEILHFQHIKTDQYRQEYEDFYQTMKTRLSRWDQEMKRYLSATVCPAATDRATESPRPESKEGRSSQTKISGLSVFYHLANMILNRHVEWQRLARDQFPRNVRETHSQAIEILKLIHRLNQDDGTTIHFAHLVKICPVTSIAIYTATDVITSAGAISDTLEHLHETSRHSLIENVSHALVALDDLSVHWQTAEIQKKRVTVRLKAIMNISDQNRREKKAFFFAKPLYNPTPMSYDAVYGPSRWDYLRALGLGDRVRRQSDIVEIVEEAGHGSV